MEKFRYETDPHNRLFIQKTGSDPHLKRFRRVLDGRFKIGPGNFLIYHVKSPVKGITQDRKAPHQVKLKGRWSLTKDHDLRLTLDKWRRQLPKDTLTLQGEIIGVDSSSFLFAFTTKTGEGALSTQVLKLEGRWQADKKNRLTFRVKKEGGNYDVLTFDGIWEIDKNHRIVYQYVKRKGSAKKRLTFKGFWDIKERCRLRYQLDLKGRFFFDFRTGACLIDKDTIKYEVGIGISDKMRPVKRVVTLFGRWKIGKGANLLFEIDYEKGRARAVSFGAEARLIGKDKLEFKLKNSFGEDLGMEFTLSRRLIEGGEAFLKLLKTKRESAAYAGAGLRW